MNIDWTTRTGDPKEPGTLDLIYKDIKSMTVPVEGGFNGMLTHFAGKSVLDIGAAAHDLQRYRAPNWKHRKIVNVASDCLGIDIIGSMVEVLRDDGFNVELCDATSDRFLGRRYQIVFMGDLIEHIHSMDSLFAFAKRHLADDGIILVATPNPYFIAYICRVLWRHMFVASCEHVSWIGESMAYELSRRFGLQLRRIYRPVSRNPIKRMVQLWNLGLFSHHFYYEFSM